VLIGLKSSLNIKLDLSSVLLVRVSTTWAGRTICAHNRPGGILSEEKPHASDVEMLVTLFKLYVHQLWAMRELLIEKGITTGPELYQMVNRFEADLSDVEVPAALFMPLLSEVEVIRRLLIEKAVFTSDELNQTFKRLEAERSFCGGFETASSED